MAKEMRVGVWMSGAQVPADVLSSPPGRRPTAQL